MMAGVMFEDTESLGEFTRTSIESYWLGFGLPWRFDRGDAGQLQHGTLGVRTEFLDLRLRMRPS